MIWVWASGGVNLMRRADAPATVEECNATISGSRALTSGVTARGAALFLQESGYTVEPAPETNTADEIKVVGARGEFRCTITIHPNTATEGVADLIAGRSLLAFTLRPMTPTEVEAMKAAGAGDLTGDRSLAQHVIAFDAMAIAVNGSAPVRALSLDQARDLAAGVKTNWTDIGGEDAPITLYGPKDGSSPEDYPNDLILHRNPIWETAGERAQIVDTEVELLNRLARDRGGLAYVSASFLAHAPGVRAVAVGPPGSETLPTPANMRQEAYAMARRVFIYVRPADMESNRFAQRFIAFFQSAAMYDPLDEAGFAALRPDSRLARFAGGLARCRFGTPEHAAVMSATRGARKLPEILHFVPGTTRLNEAALAYIAANAADLQAKLQNGDEIILVGHSDFTGEAEPNRALAWRRAIAARTAFEAQGVLGAEVESAGEMCAMADNQTDEGREANRRVEIWVRAAQPER